MKHLSRRQALAALGLQDGASQEDIRRAFRQLALQYHPDKNLSSPEAATEQFKQLLHAYQRLTASRHTDTAWEDLELADVLTEEFLDEALAQQMPAFELMFMQHHLNTSSEQQASSSCWADDHLGDASGAMKSAMWRKVYTSLQKKHAHYKQSGADDSHVRQGTRPQAGSTRLREAKWRLLWEFVSDLILKEDASQAHSTPHVNRWQQTAGSCSNSSRPAYSSDDSDASSEISSDGDVRDEQQAVRRAERRAQYRQRLRADKQAHPHPRNLQNDHGTNDHQAVGLAAFGGADSSVQHIQQLKEGAGGQQVVRSSATSGDMHCTADANMQPHNDTQSFMDTAVGVLAQQDMQGIRQEGMHATVLASASGTLPCIARKPTSKPTSGQGGIGVDGQPQTGSDEWPLAVVGGVHAAEQPVSQQSSSTLHVEPGVRQPKWLTTSNCWLWLKRILLLKALSMLLRP